MKETYILGVSAYYHDSAACLIKDGNIIAASLEERFTRIKHDLSFPQNAISFCLKFANIDLTQVEKIVFYEKPFLTFDRILETYFKNAPAGFSFFRKSLPIWMKDKLFIKTNLLKGLAAIGKVENEGLPELLFSGHHLSHGASAFFPSPFKSSAVVCFDGVGEWATTTIWHGNNNQLRPLEKINFPHSIGLLYSSFTFYCGFEVNDGEYKLMGLAPYGEARYVETIKKHLIEIKDDGSYHLNMNYFSFEKKLKMINRKFEKLFGGKARVRGSAITQREKDLAASIQVVMEEIILKIAVHAKKITGEENLCLAGGVALNCVANGKILRSHLFKDIWVQPAANDAGGALGAAMAVHYLYLKKERLSEDEDKMNFCLLGEQFSDKDIKNFLDKREIPYQVCSCDEELFENIAKKIEQNKVIGWFQGRSEFGPRALGNRSILGNALDPSMQKTINNKIKFRESFRPFAPAILEEDIGKYYNTVKKSPYMLFVDQIKDEHIYKKDPGIEFDRTLLPAITHVDDSSRIQTVSEKSNNKFYGLIKKVKERIGHGVVINTSFNISGAPIVNSPEDAYTSFLETEMDVLVLNNFILSKKNISSDKLEKLSFKKENLKDMTKKELQKFWLQTSLFFLILSYITLPFFGLPRKALPAVLILCILGLSQIFPAYLAPVAKYLKKIASTLNHLISEIILLILFFVILTPYAFLIRLFKKKQRKDLKSFYEGPEKLEVSSKMY